MINLDELLELQRVVKLLINDRKKYHKLFMRSMRGDLTDKATQKVNADMNWAAMDLDRLMRELHAKAVDCGVADIRSKSHYEDIEYHPSAFHRYRHSPAKPKSFVNIEPKP